MAIENFILLKETAVKRLSSMQRLSARTNRRL